MIQNWHAKTRHGDGAGPLRGGVGSRRLARAGARLTLTDKLPAAELEDSLAQLEGLEINYRLGGHDERDFREADLVVIPPCRIPPRSCRPLCPRACH